MTRPPLRKKLGQHHLRSGALCSHLISFLAPEGREILEIGPGGGVLTRELLKAGARRVWAVELDRNWAFELRADLGDPRLALAVGDALDLKTGALSRGALVAGNLPYGIATRVVVQVVKSYPQVCKAAFLVQREVAERLVAQPGTRAYGSLTVWVALAANARILSRVKPGSFVPPPRVESAFVGLEMKPPPLEARELQDFEDLVRLAFSQRRKTLRNTLGARWPKAEVEDLLESAGVKSGSRAEELDLADFLRIHRIKRGMIEGIGRIQKG